MSWANAIWTALKIAHLILSKWLTLDTAKKKRKTEALKEVKDALKKKDPSAVTAAFDRIRR